MLLPNLLFFLHILFNPCKIILIYNYSRKINNSFRALLLFLIFICLLLSRWISDLYNKMQVASLYFLAHTQTHSYMLIDQVTLVCDSLHLLASLYFLAHTHKHIIYVYRSCHSCLWWSVSPTWLDTWGSRRVSPPCIPTGSTSSVRWCFGTSW